MDKIDESKKVVQQLTDAWNDRDRAAFLDVHADDVTTHSSSGEEVQTAENLWAAEESGIFAAFPDVHASTESMIAEDDQVFVRWTITGTHEGEFYGIEPTGNEVEYAEWAVYRIENLQVAEAWWLGDGLGLFEQIDAVQSPVD